MSRVFAVVTAQNRNMDTGFRSNSMRKQKQRAWWTSALFAWRAQRAYLTLNKGGRKRLLHNSFNRNRFKVRIMQQIKSVTANLCAPYMVRGAVVLTMALLLPASTMMAKDKITFTTEEYPPYNYIEYGTYKGASYEQVALIMQDADIDYTVDLMPWARAYAMAQSEPMTCVFTTAHTPERNALFKWVEPLSHERNIMASKTGSNIHAHTIEEARNYRVGTQRDDYTQAFLEKNGFQKIDLASSLNLTLKKLESGRIDLIPLSERFFHELVEHGTPLEQQFVLTEQTFSLACNLSVPDTLIAKMQANLNKLIANGQQHTILVKYGLVQP